MKENTVINNIKDFAVTFAITMAAALIFTNLIARPICVKGNSMFPTLMSDSLGFASIIERKTKGIDRFDIVIIRSGEDEKFIVKRAVGLPGETIEYRSGKLYVNGEYIEEPFLDEEFKKYHVSSFDIDVDPITLKENEYYCLGDNRGASKDSRVYGPFTGDQIIAKNIFVLNIHNGDS